MTYPLPLLTAIVPALGMLSGLTASFTVIMVLVLLAFSNRSSLKFNVSKLKLETAFFIWCLICCFITPNPQKSIITFLEVFSLVTFGLVLKNNVILSSHNLSRTNKALFTGAVLAIILFIVECLSNGFIFDSFRNLFQSKSPHIFQLNSLDRGCSLLALTSWIIIGVLCNVRKYAQAIIFYVLVLLVLYVSDSLASFIGFFLAGSLMVFSKLSKKFFKFTTIAILVGSTLFPFAAHVIDPFKTSNEYSLPDSAKHRLFIWHYVVEESKLNPIAGAGFAASKQHVTPENEIIKYQNYLWNPLPLHPHNNILQIIFETGAVGFLLFMGLVFKYLNKIETSIESNEAFSNVTYACFVNYYIVGMISFSIWQTWWVASGVWVCVMFNILSRSTSSENLTKPHN